jgi:hypothetical protein
MSKAFMLSIAAGQLVANSVSARWKEPSHAIKSWSANWLSSERVGKMAERKGFCDKGLWLRYRWGVMAFAPRARGAFAKTFAPKAQRAAPLAASLFGGAWHSRRARRLWLHRRSTCVAHSERATMAKAQRAAPLPVTVILWWR